MILMIGSRVCAVLCLLVILVASPGCLVRRRVITTQDSHGKPRQLQTATTNALVDTLRRRYETIRSFNATVDMTPVIGSVYKGEITEYKDVRAYILFRKPDEIRVIGLYPVVRSKAFDMVSNGQIFRILIPSKNRFVEGRNDAPAVSKNSLENLRPDAFTNALLISPPAENETPRMIDSTDEENALYILVMIGKTADNLPTIDRSVYFDRTNLQIVRQKIYDAEGNIVSDTRYREWKVFDGQLFPTSVDINRPKDGYGVVMNVVKMDINTPLTDDKFVLNRPEGTQLHTIGTPAPAAGQPN